jgi:hypothetical protein
LFLNYIIHSIQFFGLSSTFWKNSIAALCSDVSFLGMTILTVTN